jgi:hypothetical protein
MFWRSIFDLFGFHGSTISSSSSTDMPVVNPATGLPMLDGNTGGVDVGGSPFGIDTHQSTMDSFSSMGSNPWD